jgi:hypothetical protein
MKRIAAKLTYANAMATIAVFIALGGVGYAATVLPRDSVGTEQLRDASVTGAKLHPGAVRAANLGPIVTRSQEVRPQGHTIYAFDVFCPDGTTPISWGYDAGRMIEIFTVQREKDGWYFQVGNRAPSESGEIKVQIYCLA